MDCLVTKLKGTVNDSSLMALGEIDIKYKSTGKQVFRLSSTGDVRFIVKSGNATFIGSDTTTDLGKDITVSNGEYRTIERKDDNEVVIGIMNKYNLKTFAFGDNASDYDFSELAYSPLIDYRTGASQNLGLQGDILSLPNTLKRLNIYFYKNAISISSIISKWPNLESLVLSNMNEISGNMKDLNSLAALKHLEINSMVYAKLTMEWPSTTHRSSSLPRIELSSQNYPVAFSTPTDADNFIINMSSCPLGDESDIAYSSKCISVTSRTAASNSAVQTLISDGWKVYVNAVEQTGDESFD